MPHHDPQHISACQVGESDLPGREGSWPSLTSLRSTPSVSASLATSWEAGPARGYHSHAVDFVLDVAWAYRRSARPVRTGHRRWPFASGAASFGSVSVAAAIMAVPMAPTARVVRSRLIIVLPDLPRHQAGHYQRYGQGDGWSRLARRAAQLLRRGLGERSVAVDLVPDHEGRSRQATEADDRDHGVEALCGRVVIGDKGACSYNLRVRTQGRCEVAWRPRPAAVGSAVPALPSVNSNVGPTTS